MKSMETLYHFVLEWAAIVTNMLGVYVQPYFYDRYHIPGHI